MVDRDGRVTYTTILLVKSKAVGKDLVLYPQPAKSYVSIQLTATSNQFAIAQLFNAAGNKVMEKQVQLFAGNNTFSIDKLENLPAGLYIMRVLVDGRVETEKVMVAE